MGVLPSAESQSSFKQGMKSSLKTPLKAQFEAMDWRRLLRFLVVGGLNTALSLGIYFLALYFFNAPYYVASAVSILFGIAVGFKAHGALVFGNQGSFLRYVTCWVSIYAGNTLMIALIRGYTGDYWAQIILLPFTTALSFYLMKKLVYRT
jgi:putative flippase GtrA